jgi:hypothetical protein
MNNSDADNELPVPANGAEAAPVSSPNTQEVASPNTQENVLVPPSDEFAPITGHVSFDDGDAIGSSIGMLAGTSEAMDQLADNDMHAAVVPVSADVLANLEHTLDHLVSSTDLFDVPAIDFDGANGDVG